MACKLRVNALWLAAKPEIETAEVTYLEAELKGITLTVELAVELVLILLLRLPYALSPGLSCLWSCAAAILK